MKPIEFKQVNVTIAKNQPQYQPIPAHRADDDSGTVIFCWQLTDEEKKQVMETGVIWHSSMTFGRPFQPQLLATACPFVGEDEIKHPVNETPVVSKSFADLYAYPTVEVYEQYVNSKVSEAFRIGWDMARVTNGMLGVTEEQNEKDS